MKTNPIDSKQNEAILLRVICLLGAFIAPIIKAAWSYSISPTEFFDNYFSVLQCVLFVVLFLFMFAATYWFSFVKNYAYYFIYVLYLIATISFIYVLEYNNFSVQSLLLMILFTTSINLVVKRMIHLLCFDICTLLILSFALLKADQASVSKLFIIFFFLLFYSFNYGFVNLKLKTQNALAKSEQDYRRLVETAPQAMIVAMDGKITFCNAAAAKLAGADSSKNLMGQRVWNFIDNMDILQDFEPEELETLKNDMEYHEEKFVRLDGMEVDVEVSVVHAMIAGQPAVIYVIKDISERKATEKRIHQMAYYDTLTGLPNRFHLNHAIENMISDSTDSNQNSAVLFVDLDGFKQVNDTLGHYSGDILLQEVAELLMGCVRDGDMVSRYGGDEFIILLKAPKRMICYTVAHRILEAFNHPFYVDDHELYITPSIGISLYPEDGMDVETLIKNADSAMYRAKEKGKNNFQYYSEDFSEK